MDPINTVSQVPSVPPVPPVPPLESAGQPVQTPPPPVQVPPANKTSLLFKSALFALMFSIVVAGIYIVWAKVVPGLTKKACTMEAKVCPDGSSVGRVPPTCEFSPCPTPISTPDVTANWKTYTNTQYNFSFKYPSDFTQSKDVGLFNDPTMKFILDVNTHESSLSAKDWITTKECKTMISPTQTSGGCTESTKGSIEGSLQFTFIAHYGGIHTIIKHGNTIFDISMAAREPNPNFDEIKSIYNQILSTLKFLEATPSATPQL